jgi:hypothetical protein
MEKVSPQYNKNLYTVQQPTTNSAAPLYPDTRMNNAPGVVINIKNIGKGLKFDGFTLSAVPTFVVIPQSATPAINTNIGNIFSITGIAQAITSMTSGLTGTPSLGETMMIQFTDNGTARGITWGASFESTTVSLPTTTVISTLLRVTLQWNAVTSKWSCIQVA